MAEIVNIKKGIDDTKKKMLKALEVLGSIGGSIRSKELIGALY